MIQWKQIQNLEIGGDYFYKSSFSDKLITPYEIDLELKIFF